MRAFTVLLLAAVACGCSSQATLTVYSQPSGAYLTEAGSGTVYGIAPRLLAYPKHGLKASPDGRGCYLAKGVEARWVSGAQAVMDPVRICGSATGAYSITLTRDVSTPGLDKDLQFALQADAVQAQQQQAQAASDAALIAAFSTFQQTTPVRCTSQKVGETLQTVCQ